MKIIDIYRSALIVSTLFFVMFWFAPWAYGTLDQDMQSLLAWRGYGAWFVFPEIFYWAYFVATLVGYAGMFLLRKFFRFWFLGITIFSFIILPSAGASVITGIEAFIIDTSTVLAGFVIGLAFFSPLKEKFY